MFVADPPWLFDLIFWWWTAFVYFIAWTGGVQAEKQQRWRERKAEVDEWRRLNGYVD